MEQFTFYELYADLLRSLDETSAGKFARYICAFEFENAEPSANMTDKESFYWSNIEDMLQEVKEVEVAGKRPKKYNLRSKHFTFYDTYYKAMKLLNDRQCGAFVIALCNYMFNDEEPQFADKTMRGYFNLCKRKMDLSKQRKTVGKAGGAAKKKQHFSLTYQQFRKSYPNIQGDLYGASERYKTGLNWQDVAEKYETDEELHKLQNIFYLAQRYEQKYMQKR